MWYTSCKKTKCFNSFEFRLKYHLHPFIPQCFFPNKPSEVRRNPHDAVRENKLYGNLLHPNNIFRASFERFKAVWMSTQFRDVAGDQWVICFRIS